MSDTINKAKYGYQKTYQDMLDKISSGILDAYDIVFVEETYGCYVISPELHPCMVRSKVYVFDSLSEAAVEINKATDTYVGQIISVLYKDAYRGYVVNQNSIGYYLTPLNEQTEPINYDNLGNKPIINKTGTLDEIVILSDLSDGLYAIDGQYKICSSLETTYITANKHLYSIESIDEDTIIQRLGTELVRYTVTNNSVTKSVILTSESLNNYATINYVDEKIAALDYITKQEVETYIQELLSESIEDTIDEKINEKLAESIASETAIQALFE